MKSSVVSLILVLTMAVPAFAGANTSSVRATFLKFVNAQNSHDLKSLEPLLSDSPDFLWITRGMPIWGRTEALKRFGELYKGTWRLAPDTASFKQIDLGDGVAQIFVPILFTIGAEGQAPQESKFLMNQILVRTDSTWKITSILPIPVPPAGK